MIADSYQGKKLNSPNDVVVKSDGSIWFTDPPYGILSDYEGHKAEQENGNNVYRVDGKSGAITVVADDFIRPNGLAFSPDEKKLYIVDSAGGRTKGQPKHIRVFDVGDRRQAHRRQGIRRLHGRPLRRHALRFGRQAVGRDR